MKKILIAIITLASMNAIAQPFIFSASITKTSGGNSVSVFIKPSANHTGKISGLTVALAIPTSVGTRPTITVDNSPNTNITYVVYNAIDQNISGVPHYIYNLLGTGDVGAGVSAVTYTPVDNLIVKASFSGSTGISSLVKMVNLPDGGTDPNPNSYIGLSIDGSDVVNEANMFYAIPTFSTANNNIIPGGYSGLSQAQTTELVPVPVKFRGFTVIKKDNNALLNWSVESESPITDRYEVERSVNGIDFTKIATVAPKPFNIGGTNSYDLTDFNLSSIRSSGVIYYRIKQVDRDGKYVYTEIRNIRLDGKSFVLNVFPNPVRTSATLTFDLPEAADVLVYITDAAGKEVQKLQMQGNKGLNIQKINMSTFAAGSYMLKVTAGGEVRALSVVKAE